MQMKISFMVLEILLFGCGKVLGQIWNIREELVRSLYIKDSQLGASLRDSGILGCDAPWIADHRVILQISGFQWGKFLPGQHET